MQYAHTYTKKNQGKNKKKKEKKEVIWTQVFPEPNALTKCNIFHFFVMLHCLYFPKYFPLDKRENNLFYSRIWQIKYFNIWGFGDKLICLSKGHNIND